MLGSRLAPHQTLRWSTTGWTLGLVLLSSCASARTEYRGFTNQEAAVRVVSPPAERLPPCQVRDGRLVIEVERALVREYPSHGLPGFERKQQPLLLVSLLAGPQWPREAELAPLVAPQEFEPGDPIGFFEGRRLLDRPLRLLRGRRLEIRLLENNRTAAPSWKSYAEAVSHAGAGALSALGMPGPPTSVVDAALALLVRLDRDSLILYWATPVDELIGLLAAAQGDVLRFPLATARATPAGPGRGFPSAELGLLVYREPEEGCSESAFPAKSTAASAPAPATPKAR